MKRARITGIGHCVPDKIVTNFDLAKLIDTTNEWIIERTGIHERRFSEGDMGTSDLGVVASEKALAMAGISPEDIEFIIFATISSDYYFPGSSVLVQEKLGMKNVGAFDLRAACSGFVYGLSIADQYIKSGTYENILLIGGEIQSAAIKLDTEHRDMAVLFGDGAGAAVIQATDSVNGLLSTHLHSDGKYCKELWVPAPGSKFKPWISQELLDKDYYVPSMNGREVFRHAIVRFPEVIQEALQQNDLTVDDVKLIIPHQANYRIIQAVAHRLGVDMNTVYSNIHKYGNTTAASIPIALSEAHAEGKFTEGDIIIVAAFGSGFTWASAAIRW